MADNANLDESGASKAASTKESTEFRSVFQNHLLHKYEWKPDGNIRAVIHICHGIHEYMGRYEGLAEFLKENGILVRAIDLVGHGRSEGDRGHIDSIDSYGADVIKHIKQSKQEFSELPLFLMGHSNGGAVSIGVALRIQDLLTGLILSAPGVIIEASGILKFLVKVISFIAPQTGVIGLDEANISSVPEEIQQYNEDPLVYRGKLKASWALALVQAIDDYIPRLQELTLPVLLVHGTADMLVPIAASELVYGGVSSTDKTLERFEGSRHEILHDKDQERVRQVLCQWIIDRIGTPQPCNDEANPKEHDNPPHSPEDHANDNEESTS